MEIAKKQAAKCLKTEAVSDSKVLGKRKAESDEGNVEVDTVTGGKE